MKRKSKISGLVLLSGGVIGALSFVAVSCANNNTATNKTITTIANPGKIKLEELTASPSLIVVQQLFTGINQKIYNVLTFSYLNSDGEKLSSAPTVAGNYQLVIATTDKDITLSGENNSLTSAVFEAEATTTAPETPQTPTPEKGEGVASVPTYRGAKEIIANSSLLTNKDEKIALTALSYFVNGLDNTKTLAQNNIGDIAVSPIDQVSRSARLSRYKLTVNALEGKVFEGGAKVINATFLNDSDISMPEREVVNITPKKSENLEANLVLINAPFSSFGAATPQALKTALSELSKLYDGISNVAQNFEDLKLSSTLSFSLITPEDRAQDASIPALATTMLLIKAYPGYAFADGSEYARVFFKDTTNTVPAQTKK